MLRCVLVHEVHTVHAGLDDRCQHLGRRTVAADLQGVGCLAGRRKGDGRIRARTRSATTNAARATRCTAGMPLLTHAVTRAPPSAGRLPTVERRWKVASIGGIPIYITVPWLIFAAFVVCGTYESLARRALTDQQALWWSVVNAVLFYGSIIFHELAHAATARAFGLHVHGITMVFWGGYTETHSSERGPLASFLISAAGPFSTLALAGVFWIGAVSTDDVLAAILGNLAFLSLSSPD